MRIPGLKMLKLSMRYARSRLVDNAIVLGYHRIVDKPQDPFSISVTPTHFAKHIEILCRYANPISLQDIVKALEEKRIPKRALAITFDDGYADNLYAVKPILEHYEIPATVFVVTGNLGNEFWWDKLERILLSPKRLPEKLSLKIDSNQYEWNLIDIDKEHQKSNKYKSRQNFLLSVSKCLEPLSLDDRTEMIGKISRWTEEESNQDSCNRALSANEIIELTKGDLIEIGSHTVTHTTLDKLPLEEQLNEIQHSKSHFEKLLGTEVESFSYPHGSMAKPTLAILRISGFNCACASYNDVVWNRSNPLKFPRFWIPNWDGETFSNWLKRWM
jgi:peptidoglycan/xylan/chitin deacetylase (PgdA/CDA1 family)